jgi:hypothetical protein
MLNPFTIIVGLILCSAITFIVTKSYYKRKTNDNLDVAVMRAFGLGKEVRLFAEVQFDHTKPTLREALGISREQSDYLLAITCDMIDDVRAKTSTVSQIVESVLKSQRPDNEKLLMLVCLAQVMKPPTAVIKDDAITTV